LHLIPRIQDGICIALSHYFLTHPNWPQFIEMTLAWDGQSEINPKLEAQFNELLGLIQHHQLTTQAPEHYIGDGLAAFLKEQRRPWILKNPWHAIAIKPAENGNWHLYDPNYVTGSLETAPQDLLASIHKSIGSIVSVEADASPNLCAISDRNQFIEHGGLLALCQCNNTQEMLSQLPQQYSYSKAALDGLLLRDTKGTPAWVRGLASTNPAIIALTQDLKTQLEQQNPEDSVAQLAKSIEALPPTQKSECITSLVKADAHGQDPLIEAILASGNREHFSKALETWDKTAAHVSNPRAYFQQCCTNPPSKQLIELDSSQHVDTLRYHLEQYANKVKRPVFYIDHPDDLICSAPWIRKNADNTGTLCKGPGGPLYEFLQVHQQNAPLLIVNYERFNADDIVRFNGLLDKEPRADGTPLPKNTQIIGLMNRNKPDCYQGADFYSRFDCTQLCPLMLDALKPRKIVDIAAVTAAAKSDSSIINLYHAADWEDRLLGRWVLNGDTLSFEEGELL
ncbi:MAG: hypothetical protein EBT92_19625, partial [Planctomycetes bacterium]|nr:hypothetical protein [Planctomycetota bacterium]